MSQPPLCGPPAPSSQVHLQRRGPGSHHLSSCRRAASCIRASAAFQPSCAFSLIVAVGQRGEPAFHRHIYDPGAFQPGEESISQKSTHLLGPGSFPCEDSLSLDGKGKKHQIGDGHLCLGASFLRGFARREQPSWAPSLAVAPVDTLFPSVATSRAIFSAGPVS